MIFISILKACTYRTRSVGGLRDRNPSVCDPGLAYVENIYGWFEQITERKNKDLK